MSVLKSSSFKKLMRYAIPFKSKLISVAFWALFLAIVAGLRPLILNITIDKYFVNTSKETNVIQDYFLNLINQLLIEDNATYNIKVLVVIMLIILLLEVLAQYFFVYISSWLGQDIVKVIREKLFAHLASFKVKYYDNEPVGKLITRCVSLLNNCTIFIPVSRS